MMLWKRRQKFVIVILLIFSIIILSLGISYLVNSVLIDVESERYKSKMESRGWEFTSQYTTSDGLSFWVNEKVIVSTEDIYSVDNPIHYDITATFEKPVAQGIFYLDTKPGQDPKKIITGNIGDGIQKLAGYGRIIFLEQDQSDPKIFKGVSAWPPIIEGETTWTHMIVLNDGNYIAGINNVTMFNVATSTAKLQAETNIILKNQTIETQISNSINTGLTLILIALIPIGFLVDIIVRRYF